MKKIVLTLSTFLSLTACQTTKVNSVKTEIAPPQTQSINADHVLTSLNQCYSDEKCRNRLNPQMTEWLMDNQFINDKQHAQTDENIETEEMALHKDLGKKTLIKANLSKNYMNNALIKGALNEWLTWKRPQLINTWQYYQFLRNDMFDAFKKYQIDEALVLAIMAQESGGKVHSSSRAGAAGLFQLMPATAKRLGLHGKKGDYDLRYNPKTSAAATAQYISEQLKRYNGDKAKVLAAYNSGENRFARINKYHKNQSIWDKNFFYELPRETRHYVPTVLAAMLIFQDPEKFNVKLEQVDTQVMVVQMPLATSLSELAVCLGQEQRETGWFRILRNLNSGIKADKTIKANTDLLIPKILAQTFAKNCHNPELMAMAKSFHESDFKGNQGLFSYRVKQGDSLYKLVKKFRCTSKKELARLNHLKPPRYLIRAGKHLKIPQC